MQNGSFARLGGTKTIHADVRIIGAVHSDLKPLVDKGEFHSALYNHLSACLLQPAPLRERREDIPVLAEYFVARQAERDEKEPPEISAETMQILQKYDWPGNVRQLSNVITRATVFCEGDKITPDHFPALAE
ncbi:MAG: sigma 54-interacting transcriptional regulator [bacterium]|nr:sigma 54-interacting transcriptional regulator [bacterium]